MTIAFRADGNDVIGSGHIMRCLSIADAAKDDGHKCVFITADDCYKDEIEERGFECLSLGTDYASFDEGVGTLKLFVEHNHIEILLIDSYYAKNEVLEEIRKCCVVAYIDDFVKERFSADIIINYNILANRDEYCNLYGYESTPVFLLGEAYTPLRKQFQGLPYITPSKEVNKVMFTAGGADPERIALQLVKAIKNRTRNNNICGTYEFHMVLGKYEPDSEEIKTITENCREFHIYQNVNNMAEIMRQCDVAISAAGSTLYELSACGIPTISYILEDNQLLSAKSFAEKDAMLCAGDYRLTNNFCDHLLDCLDSLSIDYDRRVRMSRCAKKLVDGNGAKRLVAAFSDYLLLLSGHKN